MFAAGLLAAAGKPADLGHPHGISVGVAALLCGTVAYLCDRYGLGPRTWAARVGFLAAVAFWRIILEASALQRWLTSWALQGQHALGEVIRPVSKPLGDAVWDAGSWVVVTVAVIIVIAMMAPKSAAGRVGEIANKEMDSAVIWVWSLVIVALSAGIPGPWGTAVGRVVDAIARGGVSFWDWVF
jgi:hypothetical protein